MTLITHPADATVFAPDLPRSYDTSRAPLELPGGKKLAVSILLHAPAYVDVLPATASKPMSMAGGVGRDSGEPKHGQVARLSQWDFGLTCGIWRLLSIAERNGVPIGVALDAYGAANVPGLAAETAARAQEIVIRGAAANSILSASMTAQEERDYIARARDAVEREAGTSSTGWFSPERATTPRTTALLREEGFEWFGEWPVDERPVPLDGPSSGITAVPYSLETEDVFELYTRGIPFSDYEQLLVDTIDSLVSGFDVTGGRFLGLSMFGWVSGQACFAGVAERTFAMLAQHPDVLLVTPQEAAALR